MIADMLDEELFGMTSFRFFSDFQFRLRKSFDLQDIQRLLGGPRIECPKRFYTAPQRVGSLGSPPAKPKALRHADGLAKRMQSLTRQLRDGRVQQAAQELEQKLQRMRQRVVGKACERLQQLASDSPRDFR